MIVKNIISSIQSVLRNERNLINSSQEVEAISLFILVRYAEVIHGEDFFYNDKENINYYIGYCECLLKKTFFFDRHEHEYGEIYDLFSVLSGVFGKINFNIIYYYIRPILSEIVKCEDFLFLADEYRLMIEAMAFDSPQLGQFYTPAIMAKVLVNIVGPNYEGKIYDPSCGSSGFLLEASKYIKNINPDIKYELIGSDISIFASLISFTNLILNGEKDFNLYIGDSIKNGGNKYNLILANPPFGKVKYKNKNFSEDGLQYIDYIFLKHIMDSLEDGGQAAVILPERFLHDNNKYCMELKNNLFYNFNVENVVSIPPGSMLPATGVKIIILHFRKTSPSNDFWVYVLDNIEKFSRKNPINISHFDDLFSKIKGHVESDNSWSVKLAKLDTGYNVFDRNIDQKFFGELGSPKEYVGKLLEKQQNLLESLYVISEKIEEINQKINEIKNNCHFVNYKLGDLVRSRPTKPLSKEILSNTDGYSVYGGNGVIGYYKDFIIQGEFIIIGRVGAYCGNVRYVEGKIWATNNTIVLECILPKIVHPSYLAKILERKMLRGLATGTAQPHLTIAKISNVDIYLPPFEIQVQIDNWLNQFEKVFSSQQENIDDILNNKDNMRDSFYLNLLRL